MGNNAHGNFFRLIPLILLGISSCVILPDLPSLPADTVSYIGHRHYEGEAGPVYDNSTKYAYWIRQANSPNATLEVGLDNGFSDTIYLTQENQDWAFAPNDKRFSPNDTTVWRMSPSVSITNDSITLGLYRLFSWTTYYLKKYD